MNTNYWKAFLIQINIAYDSNTSLDNEENYSVREKYNIQSEKKIILFFGRLVNRKGCKQLIEAYVKYIYEKGNAVLLICALFRFRPDSSEVRTQRAAITPPENV